MAGQRAWRPVSRAFEPCFSPGLARPPAPGARSRPGGGKEGGSRGSVAHGAFRREPRPERRRPGRRVPGGAAGKTCLPTGSGRFVISDDHHAPLFVHHRRSRPNSGRATGAVQSAPRTGPPGSWRYSRMNEDAPRALTFRPARCGTLVPSGASPSPTPAGPGLRESLSA